MAEHELDEVTPTTDDNDDATTQKQAACLACRKSKVRCMRSADSNACKKCVSANVECVVPEYHVGRYKGVKNKRSGLEKAIYQVEEAVKKARTSSGGLDSEHARTLQRLLDESKSSPVQNPPPPSTFMHIRAAPRPPDHVVPALESPASIPPPIAARSSFSDFRSSSFARPEHNGEATVNNADNPLQLLAIASAIPESAVDITSPSTTGKVSPDNRTVTTSADDEIQEFFSSMTSKFDNAPELDPIEQGLVTIEESVMLFE